MPNYQNGKIYKIWSPSTDKIYIGSTTVEYLSQRLSEHVSDYKRYLSNARKYVASYELMKLNDYKIELIDSFPCNSKDELLAREGYYQRLNKDIIVNKAIAGRTTKESGKEYYANNKETIANRHHKYHEDNKDKESERAKKYYLDNKDKITQYREINKEHTKEQRKEHYEQNKETLLTKNKQYREDNIEAIKARLSEKVHCECGSIHTKGVKSAHLKSKKHLAYVDNSNIS